MSAPVSGSSDKIVVEPSQTSSSLPWREAYETDVFISYSRKDTDFTVRLFAVLREYIAPRELDPHRKKLRVFRDVEDLAGIDYQRSIEERLKKSAKLLVVCSPAARTSEYVNEEIRRFRQLHSSRDLIAERAVIPVLVAGLPNNEVTEQTRESAAFPEALILESTLPLASDYRGIAPKRQSPARPPFENAWHKLLANIYGTTPSEVEAREKRRQVRRRRIVVGVLVGALAVVSALLVFALRSRSQALVATLAAQVSANAEREARLGEAEQKRLAQAKQAEAERQSQIALARQIAAQAEVSRRQRADLLSQSVWLAAEAMQRFKSLDIYSQETDETLRAGLALLPQQVALVRHNRSVLSLDFSLDNKQLITVGFETRLSEASTGRKLSEITGIDAEKGVAINPAMRYVAAADGQGNARVYDLVRGHQIAQVKHDRAILDMVFSTDGSYLATAGEDQTARVWEATTGKSIARVNHDNLVLGVGISERNKYLVSVSGNVAQVSELTTGAKVASLINKGLVRSVAFRPGGEDYLAQPQH